ncbi:MAG TPA: lipoyl(octanoyl) transferase LipB [Nitrospira sp.]|nr:lipoyl(octanoyl) transferase LipB [Nitrospira sp.]
MTNERPLNSRRPGTLLAFPYLVGYPDGWLVQERFHRERREERRHDTLLLLQHQPVYTLGRRTAPAHLLKGKEALLATGATVESVNRGGSVTYHGPGQLVGYPIVRVSSFAAGPKEYVWLLEEVLLRTLSLWDITGRRLAGKPGIFVESAHGMAKIASIGVRVDHGVSLHGFSLNTDIDLTRFSHIVPCGLYGYQTTSMAALCQTSIPMNSIMRQVAEQFGALFHLEWETPFRHVISDRDFPQLMEQFLNEQVFHA